MSHHSWAPGARPLVRWYLAAGLLVAAASRLPAQAGTDSATRLDPVVVTATRTPQPLATVGSSVAVFTAEDFSREQIDSLAQVLAGSAAPVAVSGAPGAVASLFLRGADSDQTLFLVDGIRVNDADTPSQNILGNFSLDNVARVEVVRGPQSMLYGSEAIGGVVAVESRRGEGPPATTVSVSGGSFGTLASRIDTQGAQGPWAWSAVTSASHTENDRANNQFSRQSFAARLDRQVTAAVAVGATLRGVRGEFGDPGDRFTNDPNNTDTEQNCLATVFATVKISDTWSAKLIAGGQHRRLVSDNPAPNPPYFTPSQVTVGKNDRAVLDWQNTITLADTNTLTAGVNAERSHAVNTGFGNIDDWQTFYGLFAQDQWVPGAGWHFTAGGRYDHYDTFGGQATGRATAAWDAAAGTQLRASFGTGFRAPGFLDLYGNSAYYVGNPRLRPEQARGWDFGIDQELGKRARASVTWFGNDFRDLIDYDFTVYPSTEVNVGRARTQGVEVALKADLAAGWRADLSYTYLDARNLITGARLLRRPRHNAQATVTWQANREWQLGAGAGYVAENQDVDAQSFATVDMPDYLVARVFARYAPTARLAFTLRVENALNKSYEPVNGYPALGRGIFGGAEYKF